jgi:DivIVA domain-containing protein
MTLLATEIDNVQFPTDDRGYFEAEVDTFVANVTTSHTAPDTEAGAAEAAPAATSDTVSIAARLLELAQTAADEQLAAARAEADRVMTEAREHADNLVADAHQQAESRMADAEQTAASLVQTARDKEAAIEAHIEQLRETQQNSRTDLRQLAQHLTAIADTNEGEAFSTAQPEDDRQ